MSLFFAIYILCLLVLASDISTLVLLISGVFLILALLHHTRPRWRFKKTVLIFTLLSPVLVYFEHKTFIGQDAATDFLVLLGGLRLINTKKYHEKMYFLLISILLVMSCLLYNQSLFNSIYLFIMVILILTGFANIHEQSFTLTRQSLFRILKALAMTTPIWILLFLVFPRFNISLWEIKPQNSAVSGFQESLNPGSISQLIESEEVVFRAKITLGGREPLSTLYWRGSTLDESNGIEWNFPHRNYQIRPAPKNEKLITQEIILEPSGEKFLFLLDRPVAVEKHAKNSLSQYSNMSFRFVRPVLEKIYVKAYSDTSYVDTNIDMDAELQYTENSSLFIKDLVKKLKAPSEIPVRIQVLKSFFAKQNFVYSLQPPALSDNALEDFLFRTRTGFCEHYAGAAATLLRMAGVPARVVIGYQGGEYNEYSGQYIVRGRDAHAWLEYFDKSWKRLDPTAWVAPERLTDGMQSLISQRQKAVSAFGFSFDRRAGVGLWFQKANLFLDALSSSWTQFLLTYDIEYQKKWFFDFIQQSNWNKALAIVVLILLIAAPIFVRRFWRQANSSHSEAEKQFLKLEKLVAAQLKIPRHLAEGEKTYLQRLGQLRPDLQKELLQFADPYLAYSYSPHRENSQLDKVKKAYQELTVLVKKSAVSK